MVRSAENERLFAPGESLRTGPYVFLFYDQADRPWGRRVAAHLADLAEERRAAAFSFAEVVTGYDTQPALSTAVANASIAVVLVSSALLTDEFSQSTVLPGLIAKAATNEMALLPVAVDDVWLPLHLRDVPFVGSREAPLSGRTDSHAAIAELIQRVDDLVKIQHAAPPTGRSALIEVPDPVVEDAASATRQQRSAPDHRPRPPSRWRRRSPLFYLSIVGAITVFTIGALLALPDSTPDVMALKEAPAPRLLGAMPAAVPAPEGAAVPAAMARTVGAPARAAIDGDLSSRKTEERVAPRRSYVRVTLRSTPSGAAVYQRDDLLGSTSRIFLFPRSWRPVTLLLKKSGYETLVVEIVPEEDRAYRFELAAIRAASANDMCPTGAPEMIEHICQKAYYRDIATCRTRDEATDTECVAFASERRDGCCKRRP